MTDGGAAPSGPSLPTPGGPWWSLDRWTSGMARTWSGAWCGQRGEGYGRRMKLPPWTRCRHPPGQKAQRVRIVPISAKWPYGWATRPHPNSNRPRAAKFSSCGDWGTPVVGGPSPLLAVGPGCGSPQLLAGVPCRWWRTVLSVLVARAFQVFYRLLLGLRVGGVGDDAAGGWRCRW